MHVSDGQEKRLQPKTAGERRSARLREDDASAGSIESQFSKWMRSEEGAAASRRPPKEESVEKGAPI